MPLKKHTSLGEGAFIIIDFVQFPLHFLHLRICGKDKRIMGEFFDYYLYMNRNYDACFGWLYKTEMEDKISFPTQRDS